MPKKLKLSGETLRSLARDDLDTARGALVNTKTCYWCPAPPVLQTRTASCKASVCNSCYDTDCCLASAVIG